MPLEYGKQIPFEKQISVSAEGTKIILDILEQHEIAATFFSTVIFASHNTDLISRITAEGHELASHGYFHSSFQPAHLLRSRKELERISGTVVSGFRMPRMQAVDNEAIQTAGYKYNSSLNPVYLPGRYNNFFKPRALFYSQNVMQVPASVTPVIRFPLFWLSFHNVPLGIYKAACSRTMNCDGYLNIYFHPWEFTDLTHRDFGLPRFVSKKSGIEMIDRFQKWILWMKEKKYNFSTIQKFLESHSSQAF